MSSRFREGLAPAYLLLCLVLGGSAQGIWANMVLQLLGIGVIAWAATRFSAATGSMHLPQAPGEQEDRPPANG